MMAFAVRAAALAASLAGVAATPSLGAERTNFDFLMVAFDQMALREHGVVTKWTSPAPIKIKMEGKVGDKENAVIAYAIEVVRKNTNVTIVRDDREANPEIAIELSKKDLSFGGMTNPGGVTRPVWGKYGGELKKAAIAIRHDWYRGDIYYFNRVIPHELMHAVGFPEHAQGFDSVSSYHAPRYSYSEWDEMFMRVLYDPRLKAGTPRVFALPIACRILHERLLADMAQLVPDLNRQGGTHPYCDQLAKAPIEAKKPIDNTRIGWAYANGLGVEVNFDEAETWLRRAVDKKESDAGQILATLQKTRAVAAAKSAAPPAGQTAAVTPSGAPKSPPRHESKIAALTAKARGGDANAQFQLGLAYRNGNDVAADAQQAIHWLRLAGDRNPIAFVSLGDLYELGKGVPKDAKEAVKWYSRAAEASNPLGLAVMARVYRTGLGGTPQNHGRARELALKAAESRIALAYVQLAELSLAGQGGDKSASEAYVWAALAYDAMGEKSPLRRTNERLMAEAAKQLSAEELERAKQTLADRKAATK